MIGKKYTQKPELMKTFIKRVLANSTVDHCYSVFRFLFFDPIEMVMKWRGIPSFICNLKEYRRTNTDPSLSFRWKNATPVLSDRYDHAGAASGHYFWQDLWAAKYLFEKKRLHHVTVGSRIDGFVAHILPFCKVTYIDIRPLLVNIEGLEHKQGSILHLPYEDNSVDSISCLHVLEHIGLGRYGDPVRPDGHLHAAKECSRVLAPGGELLIGTPIGVERLCFNAHRIFDPETIISIFSPLKLVDFSMIDDQGQQILFNQPFEAARRCKYGCGLFVFTK